MMTAARQEAWWQAGCRLGTLRPPWRFRCGGCGYLPLRSTPAPKKLRQLSNIYTNAPRFIEGENLRNLGFGFCLSRIDIGKSLAGCVQHLEAARRLLGLARAAGTGVTRSPMTPQNKIIRQRYYAKMHEAFDEAPKRPHGNAKGGNGVSIEAIDV